MQNLDMILLAILLSGILITSICLYIGFIRTIYYCRLKERVCTKNIEAKVIRYKERYAKGGRAFYIPTYMYEYDGVVYEYKAKIERHMSNSLENEMTIIVINPDNPSMVYEQGSQIYTPLMGVCAGVFVVAIVWIFGCVIKYLIFGL